MQKRMYQTRHFGRESRGTEMSESIVDTVLMAGGVEVKVELEGVSFPGLALVAWHWRA